MASGPNFNNQRGTWWVQWFDGTKWRRETVTKKLHGWKPGDSEPKKAPPEAHAAFAKFAEKERRARLHRGVSTETTVRDFLEAYSEAYIGREPGSKSELDKAIRVFLEWAARRGLKRLSQINAAECMEWLENRATTIAVKSKKPIAHATLKKERALLAGAWSNAVKRERLTANPWRSADVPSKPETKRRGSWSPKEFERLLAKSRPWLRTLLVLGVNAGMRIEALRGLLWSDVRFGAGKQGEIVVRPELDKAHKGYSIPMTEKCHDMLAARFLHRSAHVDNVIVGERGDPIKRSNVTHKAIIDACRRAGLKKPDSPNHHMRRTFGRWAVMGHLTGRAIPAYVVSRWLGHASIAMTEKYLQLSEEDSAKWIEQADGQSSSPQADRGQEPEST